jgi:hypothetical protein
MKEESTFLSTTPEETPAAASNSPPSLPPGKRARLLRPRVCAPSHHLADTNQPADRYLVLGSSGSWLRWVGMTGDMGDTGTTTRRKKGNKVSLSDNVAKNENKSSEVVGAEVAKQVESERRYSDRECRRGAYRKTFDTI